MSDIANKAADEVAALFVSADVDGRRRKEEEQKRKDAEAAEQKRIDALYEHVIDEAHNAFIELSIAMKAKQLHCMPFRE